MTNNNDDNNNNLNDDKKIEILSKNDQLIKNMDFQKQNFEKEILEINLVLEDIENKNEVYKIIGSIIIKKDKDEIKSELNEKLEILKNRITNINKKINSIQKEQEEIQNGLNL